MSKNRMKVLALIIYVGMMQFSACTNGEILEQETEHSVAETLEQETEHSIAETLEQETKLPIAENEVLLIAVGESKHTMLGGEKLLIVDQNGGIVDQLDGYGIVSLKGKMSRAVVVKEERPMVLFHESGNGNYEMGLYSFKEKSWLIEPAVQHLEMFGTNLVTNSNPDMLYAGKLMDTNGTVISDTGFVTKQCGAFVNDGKSIYDLQGNELLRYNESEETWNIQNDLLLDYIWEDAALFSKINEDLSIELILKQLNGETVWTESSGAVVQGRCKELLSWIEQDGTGRITDMTLQQVMTEEEFRQKNEEIELHGSRICLAAQSPDGTDQLIRMRDENLNDWYYRCNEAFVIKESYPANQIYLESPDNLYTKEAEYTPWYWEIEEDGTIRVEQIWTGESVSWKQDRIASDQIEQLIYAVRIFHKGKVIGLCIDDPEGNKYFFCEGADGTEKRYMAGAEQMESLGAWMNQYEDGTVEVYCTLNIEKGDNRVLYFDSDGNWIDGEDDMLLYRSQDMKCWQDGNTIRIENLNSGQCVSVNIEQRSDEGGE